MGWRVEEFMSLWVYEFMSWWVDGLLVKWLFGYLLQCVLPTGTGFINVLCDLFLGNQKFSLFGMEFFYCLLSLDDAVFDTIPGIFHSSLVICHLSLLTEPFPSTPGARQSIAWFSGSFALQAFCVAFAVIITLSATYNTRNPGTQRIFAGTRTKSTLFHGFFHFNLPRSVTNQAMGYWRE